MTECTKHRYLTRAIAKKDLKNLKKKGVDLTYVYQCNRCGYWHLTSQAIGLRYHLRQLFKK